MSFTSSWYRLFLAEEETVPWRSKKLVILAVSSLLIGVSMFVAVVVLSVLLFNTTTGDHLPEEARKGLGGWGRWERVGECSRECGGGERVEQRTCRLSETSSYCCRGNNTRRLHAININAKVCRNSVIKLISSFPCWVKREKGGTSIIYIYIGL